MPTRQSELFHQSKRALAVAIAAASVAACSNSSNNEDAHEHTDIDSAGRLSLYNSDANRVDVYDLKQEQVVASFAMTGSAARLYASPEKRFVVAIQRDDDRVSFIDSGLYVENHGDHMHEYEQAPSMSALTLSGKTPTHYTAHGEYGVIFNDGADGVLASIEVMSDESLLADQSTATMQLDNNMHGVAKIIDGQLFVTRRDSSITDTSLPAQVQRYNFDGSNFSNEFTYSEACPKLHGAAANEDYLVFGCGDGVLAIDLNDANYSATHTTNPSSIADGARIGRIYAHHEASTLVGSVGYPTAKLFKIQPSESSVISPLALPDDAGVYLSGFSHEGDKFFTLAADGKMHFFSTSDWALQSSLQVIPAIAESDAKPLLAQNGANDMLYLLDPRNQEIKVLDTDDKAVLETLELDFTASSIAWTGLVESDGHAH